LIPPMPSVRMPASTLSPVSLCPAQQKTWPPDRRSGPGFSSAADVCPAGGGVTGALVRPYSAADMHGREHTMKTTAKAATAAATAAAGAGLAVIQIRRSRTRAAAPGASAECRNRWRAVTVNKPAAEVAPDGKLPEPLAELGDSVEVRITPAPDGKGTELAARLRAPEPSGPASMPGRLAGSDPRQAVRSALRESKALIEVGEILRMDPRPAGQRTLTPGGKLLDAVTKRARAEGVL
jgi:hypothetical protein